MSQTTYPRAGQPGSVDTELDQLPELVEKLAVELAREAQRADQNKDRAAELEEQVADLEHRLTLAGVRLAALKDEEAAVRTERLEALKRAAEIKPEGSTTDLLRLAAYLTDDPEGIGGLVGKNLFGGYS